MAEQEFDSSVILLFLGLIILFCVSVSAEPPGFLSISCGSSSNFNDTVTGLPWVTDAPYVQTGSVASLDDEALQPYLRHLRYFPDAPTKHCYVMPVQESTTYLVRTWFRYGNYDGLNKTPTFDLLFNANEWITNFTPPDKYYYEITIKTQNSSNFSVCVARTSPTDTPFISALELRPLLPSMYSFVPNENFVLSLHQRMDTGSLSVDNLRYPDDDYDRIWNSDNSQDPMLDNINTSNAISAGRTSYYENPPLKMLSTARTTKNTSSVILYNINPTGKEEQFFKIFYFAEIEDLGSTGERVFNISYTNQNQTQLKFGSANVAKLAGGPYRGLEVRSTEPFYVGGAVNCFTFEAILPNSTVGPILNGVEIFRLLGTLVPETYYVDVQTLEALKSNWNLFSWTGDPCLPVTYKWEWLNCSIDSPPRVTTLNLSNMNLSGSIPNEITNLKALTTLWLNNNNLTGAIPDLSTLSNLSSLFLQNNNLNGTIPQDLANNKGMDFRFSGNPHLCLPGNFSCTTSKKSSNKNIGKIVGEVLGPVLGFGALLAFAIYFLRSRNRKKTDGPIHAAEPYQMIPILRTIQQFSYAEVESITENFRRSIGKGGFGLVYYGKLPATGQEVAIKRLSKLSHQGSEEFHNEVALLSKIYHKHLVSFVGFCEESGDCILLTEYMSKGDLGKNLYGEKSSEALDWNTRLNIALNAAQGLEYLHKGCQPPIIHRDVKSSNILLNQSYVAKVADFGISKLSPEGTMTASMSVKGTFGYLDPEYFNSHRLTEKSDVYSFGVLLLEIISGRPPIDARLPPHQINIREWAYHLFNEGRIDEIADPRLTAYSIEAMWKVAEIAISCVELPGIDRPNMSDIVMALKEAVAFENNKSPTSSSDTNSWRVFDELKNKTYYSGPQSSSGKPATTSTLGIAGPLAEGR